MKSIYVALVILLGVLQYQLWWADGSVRELNQLKSNLLTEQELYKDKTARNYALIKQIHQLKTNDQAIVAVARHEHNMIMDDETYFQIVEK